MRLRKYLLTGGSDIDLYVEQGRAETAAAPIKDSNSRFRMRTPTAVSAVRGTVFRILTNTFISNRRGAHLERTTPLEEDGELPFSLWPQHG